MSPVNASTYLMKLVRWDVSNTRILLWTVEEAAIAVPKGSILRPDTVNGPKACQASRRAC